MSGLPKRNPKMFWQDMPTFYGSNVIINLFGCPGVAFISVAAGTGIGCSQFVAEIRSRNGKTVMVTGIYHHIKSFRHMATGAPGTLAVGGMKMMLLAVINFCLVTLCTQSIPLYFGFAGMRIM